MRPGGTPDRRIEFRVGIHLGDVVEESDGNVMLSRKSAIESCVTVTPVHTAQSGATFEIASFDRFPSASADPKAAAGPPRLRALTDVELMKLWMALRGDGDSSGQPLPCFTALPPASATSHSANARTCGFPAESGDMMMKNAREPTSVCLNGATSAPDWIRSSTSG
jgi:hypothetical protein